MPAKRAPRKAAPKVGPRRKPGRPTKRTPENVEKILEALRVGMYKDRAALLVGIGEATLYRWLKTDTEFREAVKAAECESEFDALKRVREGASGWQGAGWFLERKHWALWGKRGELAPTEEGGPNTTAVQIVVRGADGKDETIG